MDKDFPAFHFNIYHILFEKFVRLSIERKSVLVSFGPVIHIINREQQGIIKTHRILYDAD